MSSAPRILIRADGGASTGMGHVMRTLPIAEELRGLGACVTYACANADARQTISSYGFDSIILNTDYQQLDSELPTLIGLIKSHDVDFVFVDSFFATNDYFRAVRKFCLVGSFAYEKKFSDGLDLFVSYLPSDDDRWIDSHFWDGRTAKLRGLRYAPFRSEFSKITPQPIDGCVNRVLILSGGSDCFGMGPQILNAMRDDSYWDDVEKWIVVGPLSASRDIVREMASNDETLTVFETVKNMAELMVKCDIAITACGYTAFELALCGVPMVTFATSDDQVNNGYVDGIMDFAGDVRKDTIAASQQVCEIASRLANDADRQRAMISASARLGIDARGAGRIAAAVVQRIRGQLDD